MYRNYRYYISKKSRNNFSRNWTWWDITLPIIDPESIKQILTLRYDSTFSSTLPKLSWKDFVEQKIPDNYLEIIENSIISYIQENINPKNKISISLSSGVDSTLVASILRKTFPDIDINSISVTFADSVDESPGALKISEKLETSHHVLPIDNFLLELPKAIDIVKQPFWDLHWYYIVKKAKTISDYFFSGDGGDELFGGYTFRYKKFLTLINDTSSPIDKIKAYLECHERDWVLDQERLFGNKIDFSWTKIYSLLEKYFDNELSPLAQVFLADYNGKLFHNMAPLYNELHKFFEIQNLTPLLSKQIISFASHIPSELKYNSNTNIGKIPLRKLLTKYNVDKFVTTKKQGFSVNTSNLWKKYGKKICQYYLTNARISRDDWIDSYWIKKHLNDPDLEIRTINKFLGLLAFEIWYRLFITNEMKSDETLQL